MQGLLLWMTKYILKLETQNKSVYSDCQVFFNIRRKKSIERIKNDDGFSVLASYAK